MPRKPASLIALLLLAVPASAQPGTAWRDPTPRVAAVTVRSQAGALPLRAIVADSEESRVRGLSGHALGPGEAILYDFGERRPVRMWTRDDKVPLDMVFIAEEGLVAFLRRDLPPGDETPVSSGVPVRYVLELAAGSVARSGIAVGDGVTISRAGVPPAPAIAAPEALPAAPPQDVDPPAEAPPEDGAERP